LQEVLDPFASFAVGALQEVSFLSLTQSKIQAMGALVVPATLLPMLALVFASVTAGFSSPFPYLR
jgi:hypothetical protein